ncbi:GNAT family N-acetyltransferase [Streptomyces sp. NBC_00190]|uniref:GNAT family N-acetyltransferase n=1 Tax=unclassified Streptomyces TaxID=2593676 RepID=UPI002E2866AB|nr:GNAT family N-acetyltransferase [Streptomyces sp. NBC_00190]WSZ38239.1 GNAT family N-acetyltransferase [Streptomyces sp. NBC_00868]
MSEDRLTSWVKQWIDGWTVSRGAADPVEEPWGWTIAVGLSKEVARHVVPVPAEADVRKLAATAPQGTWLKLFAPDDVVRPWAGDEWQTGIAGFLMTLPLAAASAGRPPAGYTVTTWTRGGVIKALVRTGDGRLAARGQVGLADRTAVADQIETAPDQRRQGLGGLVMRTLQNAAWEAGARDGVLVGTPDGKALYEALGWTLRSPMASLTRRAD